MLSSLLVAASVAAAHARTARYTEYAHTSVSADGVEISTVMEANEPTLCDPAVQQYSGYLKAGGTKNEYFYWFFESRGSPSKDPLIMWLTGGPGCSSQLALLVENGPCTVLSDASGTSLNAYSWTAHANMMWVDQPPGTGFSTGKEVTTEAEIAADMWAFLQNFVAAFPQYNENGFYVIGESYGGHYVPNVMNYIWRQNAAGAGTRIDLRGFGIGNGLTDPLVQFAWYAPMAFNSSSALASPYAGIPIGREVFNAMEAQVAKCQAEIAQCNESGAASDCDDAYSLCMDSEVEPVTATGVNPYNLDIKCEVPGLCYDFSAETIWLNNRTVQQQLGVDMKWASCDTLVNIRLEADWMKDYQQLLAGPIEDGVRGLIYAGDLDFICNWLGNQAWALALPWAGQAKFNSTQPVEWLVNGKAAGTIRQAAGVSNFSFVRVYKAGHMVPMDQPPAAQQLVEQFVADTLKP